MALIRVCSSRIKVVGSQWPRLYATTSDFTPSTNPYQVFDRKVKRIQKDRTTRGDGGERSRVVDYVRDEVADRMLERFLDIKRTFNTIVDLGAGPGHFSKLLEKDKVQKSILIDSSEGLLHRDPDSEYEVDVERIHGDEENLMKLLSPDSQEAVVSCLNLHWVNDLPGTLVQIRQALKPDGLFLGAMFGGETLFELRTSLQLAEVEREGGISPHVSPMTDTRDVSNLLGRAGFTLLTVDIDEVKVAYPSMWELMEDLQNMGESNAIIGRRNVIRRDTLAAASAIYKEMHGNEDGSVPATFQVIYMIGWKPAPNQPKPLERGSGKVNLKEVL
ncbi:S-adenosyl-L-methionine-dependent methyltransferase [Panaeolus papilionaceus]|nr:S-adenosyl-L-methionine-dependent methyltransferase [Panaeolus papilionaceus]